MIGGCHGVVVGIEDDDDCESELIIKMPLYDTDNCDVDSDKMEDYLSISFTLCSWFLKVITEDEPQLYLFLFIKVCKVISPTEMECPSPKLPKTVLHLLLHPRPDVESPGIRSRRSIKLEADLGFSMDKVKSLEDLSNSGVDALVMYHPDPVVFNFTEPNNIKKFKGEVLIFEVMCTFFGVKS